jgi:hypothetical protein
MLGSSIGSLRRAPRAANSPARVQTVGVSSDRRPMSGGRAPDDPAPGTQGKGEVAGDGQLTDLKKHRCIGLIRPIPGVGPNETAKSPLAPMRQFFLTVIALSLAILIGAFVFAAVTL